VNGSNRSTLRDVGSAVLTGVLALVALAVFRLAGLSGRYAPVVAFAAAVPVLVYRGAGPVDVDDDAYRAARGRVGAALDVALVAAAGGVPGVLATYAGVAFGLPDPWPQAVGIVVVVLGANVAFFARNWAFLRVAVSSGD